MNSTVDQKQLEHLSNLRDQINQQFDKKGVDNDGVYYSKLSPPANLEVEKALLAALLHNNNVYEKISDFLQASHFASRLHSKVYNGIASLLEIGQVVDPLTLSAHLSSDNDVAQAGGKNFITDIVASHVSVVNAYDYGRIIYDLFLRRQLINIGEDVINNAHKYDLEQNAGEQIEQIESQLFSLAVSGTESDNTKHFASTLSSVIADAQTAASSNRSLVGVTTGLSALDKRLGGFHKSDLIIIAGRPFHGKNSSCDLYWL